MGLTPSPAIGRGESGDATRHNEEFRLAVIENSGSRQRVCVGVGLGSNKAHAVGAPAGTVINNTAEVSYTVGTVNATASSNLVTRHGRGNSRRHGHGADAERQRECRR